MNVRSVTANKRLLLFLGLAAAAVLVIFVEPGFIALFIALAVLYGAFRFVAGPLSRLIALRKGLVAMSPGDAG